MGFDVSYEEVCAGVVRVEHFLYDVVTVLVPHHFLEVRFSVVCGRNEDLDDMLPGCWVCKQINLLRHIRRKFMARYLPKVLHQIADQLSTEVRLRIRHDMLNHVVPILVHHQLPCKRNNLVQNRNRRLGENAQRVSFAVLKDLLDDPASIGVCCKAIDVVEEGGDNERALVGNHLNALLDDVVAVCVCHTAWYAVVQLGHNLLLETFRHKVKRLLHNTAPVGLHREVNDGPLHRVDKLLTMTFAAVLKELLDDVVSEDVGHEVERLRSELIEDA